MQQSPSSRPPRPSESAPGSLAGLNDTGRLAEVLPAPGQWRPVPHVSDRAFWDAVDTPTRQAILHRAEEFRTRGLAGADGPRMAGLRGYGQPDEV